MQTHTTTIFRLEKNNMDDAGVGIIAEALKSNNTIQSVWYMTTSVGSINLCQRMKFIFFAYHRLGENNIGDAGAISIADALERNQNIRTIA